MMSLYEYLLYEKGYLPEEAVRVVKYYEYGIPLPRKWWHDILDFNDYQNQYAYNRFLETYK